MASSSNSGPIEAKVSAATFGATGIGIALAILNAIQDQPELLGAFPVWLQSLVLALVPGLVVFTAGYTTKHTPRPDVTGDASGL